MLLPSALAAAYSISNRPGVSSRALAAARRHRVKVQPAVVLRGEHQLLAAPHELRIRAQCAKHTAGAVRRAISRGDTLVGEIGAPDRPGVAGAVREYADLVVHRREAQKCEACSVGRPTGLEIEGEARVHPTERLIGKGVHTDEAVIAAGADERELGPVG